MVERWRSGAAPHSQWLALSISRPNMYVWCHTLRRHLRYPHSAHSDSALRLTYANGSEGRMNIITRIFFGTLHYAYEQLRRCGNTIIGWVVDASYSHRGTAEKQHNSAVRGGIWYDGDRQYQSIAHSFSVVYVYCDSPWTFEMIIFMCASATADMLLLSLIIRFRPHAFFIYIRMDRRIWWL
jgi:hypothetical protein